MLKKSIKSKIAFLLSLVVILSAFNTSKVYADGDDLNESLNQEPNILTENQDITTGGAIDFVISEELLVEPLDRQIDIEDILNELKDYYNDNGEDFGFRTAAAYNMTSNNISDDIELIKYRFKPTENSTSASQSVGNIIGLIASGRDPRNYNGKDYVKTLQESQNNEGKFMIGQYDDYPTTIAFSILALDMVDANYNVDKAISALLSHRKTDGSEFGGIDETAMSIMALANHRDISGVNAVIEQGLSYIRANQLDSGGFESWGAENPYSISAVIQSLVALGENPLDEKWMKNGKTMLDALLNFKEEGEKYFVNKSQWGNDISMATDQAFAAISDLHNMKSMFYELKPYDEDNVKVVEITAPSSYKFKNGEEARLNLSIENTSDDSQETLLIVALYDKQNGKMMNYSFVSQTLGIAEIREMGAGFLIPKEGVYEVKCFVWNNFDDRKILMSEPIVIDVEK